MATYDLLELELHAPLAYRGLENPPLAGLPLEGSILLPAEGGALLPFALGAGLAEGEEELFAFEADTLVAFDPDEGPRLARPLPAAAFYGRSSGGACPGCAARSRGGPPEPRPAPAGGVELGLPVGRYLFLQFRPADQEGLAEGIEWFAREAWWEGKRAEGPYLLRRVKEDHKLATQILRRLQPQA